MKRTLPAPACRLFVRKARVFEPPPIHELRSAVGKAAPCHRGDRVDYNSELSFRWGHLAENLLDGIALLTWRREGWSRSRQTGEPVCEPFVFRQPGRCDRIRVGVVNLLLKRRVSPSDQQRPKVEVQALQSLALRVGEADTTSGVFKCIVDGLSAQNNVALARVWLILPGDLCDSCLMREKCPDRARCLHLVASAGNPRESSEDWSRLNGDFQRIPLNAQKVGEIGALGEPILIGSDLGQSRWAERPDWALREAIVGFAGQPLVLRGQILGVLAVFSRAQITQSEFNGLRIFADHAAVAIANARAVDALRRVEEKLRHEERELRRTIDTIPALVSGFLPDGSNEFMNQRWHDYTGLSPEESQREGWQQAVHPDDLPPLLERFSQARATGEPDEIETRLRRHDGMFRWFFVRAVPLHDDTGNVVKWYATSTDIEDRKQAEEKLRQDERELRRITDMIAQMIVVHDPEGTPIYANQAVLDYTGLTIDDVTRPDYRSRIIHPDDFERHGDMTRDLLLRGLPFEIEARGRRKDGQYRWFLNRYNPFRDEQGRLTRWYATATDIEDRKRAEDRTKNENVALREEVDRNLMFEEIVGSSDAIRQVLEQVAKVAPTDSTVLISGETGTGKELLARAIHKRSKRASRAFIRVNCGAIPSSLIASELFGHEKGAFTGAFQRRIGHFEAADGGTILLDEIGDLPKEMQSALLRVLQEEEFQRVGSSQSVSVDVRVLAATNSDLKSAVAAGKFREDLFYRLNVFPICLPPLRERPEDISLLVEYLVTRYAQKAGKKFRDITNKTLQLFRAYRWPGNIRELQNVIERAIVLCDGDTFSVDESWLRQESSPTSGPVAPLVTTLEDRERQMIEDALVQSRGRISGPTGAAAKLRIPRQTLDRKIQGLGIDKNRFKSR
jgi:formate hydrogenlyase transcriptional activator